MAILGGYFLKLEYLVSFNTIVISFVLTILLIPFAKRFSYQFRFMIDRPSVRRIHTQPIPRTGGIVMILAFVLAILSSMMFILENLAITTILGILIASLVGALIGICDDLYGMHAFQKLSGQFIVSLVLIASDLRVDKIILPFHGDCYLAPSLSFPLTLLWVATVMNAINLIDGLDGSAAGLSFIAAVSMSFISYQTGNTSSLLISVGIAGTCLGFLRYNYHPASVFMGDSGSMFIGATFSGLSLLITQNGTTNGSLWIPVSILVIPFLDTILAVIRRVSNGKNVFLADTEHLHHQLLNFGFSQRQITLIFYLISILMGILTIICFNWTNPLSVTIIVSVDLILLIFGLIITTACKKRL